MYCDKWSEFFRIRKLVILEKECSRHLGLHEEGTGVKQPETRKETQVTQNGSEWRAGLNAQTENEGPRATLKVLNFILNPTGTSKDHKQQCAEWGSCYRKTTLAVSDTCLWRRSWGQEGFPRVLKSHFWRESTLQSDLDMLKEKLMHNNQTFQQPSHHAY